MEASHHSDAVGERRRTVTRTQCLRYCITVRIGIVSCWEIWAQSSCQRDCHSQLPKGPDAFLSRSPRRLAQPDHLSNMPPSLRRLRRYPGDDRSAAEDRGRLFIVP